MPWPGPLYLTQFPAHCFSRSWLLALSLPAKTVPAAIIPFWPLALFFDTVPICLFCQTLLLFISTTRHHYPRYALLLTLFHRVHSRCASSAKLLLQFLRLGPATPCTLFAKRYISWLLPPTPWVSFQPPCNSESDLGLDAAEQIPVRWSLVNTACPLEFAPWWGFIAMQRRI